MRQMSRQNHVRRVALLCGASLVAVAAMAPTMSMAQETAQSDDAATVDEVVVTGIRAQLRSAQAIKKNSEVIVDSVTAVDIGALPDRSVSEALQRIPGITLQRTNSARDPARLAAEGGGVFVRGLSGVRSETNGRDIFSASSGRGLSFEDVSADLLSGVDVYKNVAANMIEGGIAGTINLRTRVPFDNSEPLLAINADYNYGDLSEKGFWSGSIIGSDRWDTKIGEFGLMANVSISNVGNRTDSISADRYDPVVLTADSADGTGQAGETVYIPKNMGWRTIDWEQKRTAVALAAQWRPNDQWLFTLQALGSQADSYNVEYAMGSESILTPNSTYSYNDAGYFVSGEVFDANYTTDTRVGDDTKKTGDVALNFKYTPGGAWSFSGDLQYVKSTAKIYSLTAFTQLEDRPDLQFTIDGDLPTITSSGGSMDDKSSYWWAAAMDHIEDNEADEIAGRLDARYDFQNNDFFRSIEFGVRTTDKNYTNRQTGYNWNLLSNQYWLGNTNTVYLDDTGYAGGTQDSRLTDSSFLYTFDNFFRGDTSVPGVAWFPTAGLLNQGTAHAYDILKNTQSAGWGWTPLSDDYDSYRLGSGNGGVTDLQEKTEAAYIYSRFGNDTGFFGRAFDGNVGLRVVKTKTETNQVITLPSITGACPTGADCTDFNEAVQFVSGGPLDAGADVSKEYTNVLPSLNLRAFLTETLQARVAVSRAILRPEMYQLQPFTNLSINFEADGYTLNPTTPYTGTGGNPNLEPLKSTNYDFSLEWYFAPTGSITFAAFHKDLQDFIYSGSSTETFTNGGVTYDFLITRYTNGDEGKIDGFELAYSQFYDFLPGPLSGLGVQANFTYVDSSGGRNTSQSIVDPTQNAAAGDDLPLEGLSKTSYNAAILYEKYGISARLAYNWREEYLMTTSAANVNAPVWASDFGQLDGSIFYNLTSEVKIGIQSTNILNERTVLKVGYPGSTAPYNWVDTDRRIAVVLRAAF